MSQYFSILIWNLYFLTKTEWEKCPICDILDKPTKIFQIRRVCAIINHDLFWCQKLPKTNLWMTLGLIFNHIFKKYHFGAFSVFYTNYSLILGDKKIQTQKWCIREKFRHQKLGVTKGFYLLKFFLFLISATFWKNDCSATWLQYFQSKNFHLGQLSNHP